ncbi:MAG: DUF3598 family protein [Phormidesmis sp.]
MSSSAFSSTANPNIREAMPVLVRHEGQWLGTYTTIDNEGIVLDQHQSRITCQFPAGQSHPYYQTNRYTWFDSEGSENKVQEYQFPGTYRDKSLWFDTERIEGRAWEADNRIVILKFAYKDISDTYVYEMIHISDCNNHRGRTWHWFKQGEIYQRTLIKEKRIS